MIEMKVTNLHQVVSIDDDFSLVDEIQEFVKQVLKPRIEVQKIHTKDYETTETKNICLSSLIFFCSRSSQ